MTTTPGRRWSFSLRTLFVLVTVAGLGSYWIVREAGFRRAGHAYEQSLVDYHAEVITAADLYNASLHLYEAETSVPFANREKAAIAHLGRVAKLKKLVDLVYGQGYPAHGHEDELSKAVAEVAGFYAEAEKLASESQ